MHVAPRQDSVVVPEPRRNKQVQFERVGLKRETHGDPLGHDARNGPEGVTQGKGRGGLGAEKDRDLGIDRPGLGDDRHPGGVVDAELEEVMFGAPRRRTAATAKWE
jgi:hypothetical protein